MSIEIRVAQLQDASAIQAIYALVVTDTAISFEEVPPTAEEIQQRIVATLRPYPYLHRHLPEGRLQARSVARCRLLAP
ncbi:hypothetical protein D3C71_338420 [compost metagenome]